MQLPKLEGKTGSTELNRRFLGYRHVDAPDEGAFYEMENVTSERYPLMAPRSRAPNCIPCKTPAGCAPRRRWHGQRTGSCITAARPWPM